MEPNTLYITISLPHLAPYQALPPDFYRPYLTSNFNPKTYETSIATSPTNTAQTEEFSWGIYWVNHLGEGTFYTLDRLPEPTKGSPTYTLRTSLIPPSVIRFDPTIIGMLKVLHLPLNIQHGMDSYLAWLTAVMALTAARTFIWATTTYARCRKHVVHTLVGMDGDESDEFEINGFLEEALGLAYGDVRHALMGRGCVPVWTSDYGVEVLEDDEDEQERAEKDHGWFREEDLQSGAYKKEEGIKEKEVVDFDTAWPRLSDVYRA